MAVYFSTPPFETCRLLRVGDLLPLSINHSVGMRQDEASFPTSIELVDFIDINFILLLGYFIDVALSFISLVISLMLLVSCSAGYFGG